MTGFRFLQSSQPPVLPATGESHALRAIEGQPDFAALLADPGVEIAGAEHEYRLELLTDTGPAAEPYGAMMLVAFDVPADRTEAVADWYDQEHIMLLMRADGWLRARRFNVVDYTGKRWTSLAFHELRDVSVMASEERKIARGTPWRAELEREAWFGAAGRWVFLPG